VSRHVGSSSRMDVYVGHDASVECRTHEERTPFLSVEAGGAEVTFCLIERPVSTRAVEFARELARQAQVFADEAERLHDSKADGKDDPAAGEAA
jgi:hypothetical protein